jgi:hypothetical protein
MQENPVRDAVHRRAFGLEEVAFSYLSRER